AARSSAIRPPFTIGKRGRLTTPHRPRSRGIWLRRGGWVWIGTGLRAAPSRARKARPIDSFSTALPRSRRVGGSAPFGAGSPTVRSAVEADLAARFGDGDQRLPDI